MGEVCRLRLHLVLDICFISGQTKTFLDLFNHIQFMFSDRGHHLAYATLTDCVCLCVCVCNFGLSVFFGVKVIIEDSQFVLDRFQINTWKGIPPPVGCQT